MTTKRWIEVQLAWRRIARREQQEIAAARRTEELQALARSPWVSPTAAQRARLFPTTFGRV